MQVLIANTNAGIFKGIYPKIKFNPSTANTSTFSVSPTKFEEIRQAVRAKGYNPFTLMYW